MGTQEVKKLKHFRGMPATIQTGLVQLASPYCEQFHKAGTGHTGQFPGGCVHPMAPLNHVAEL